MPPCKSFVRPSTTLELVLTRRVLAVIQLKIKYQDKWYRAPSARLPSEISFDELHFICLRVVKADSKADLSLEGRWCYVDSEGDEIELRNDSDLQHALELATDGLLKIIIHGKAEHGQMDRKVAASPAMPSQTTTRPAATPVPSTPGGSSTPLQLSASDLAAFMPGTASPAPSAPSPEPPRLPQAPAPVQAPQIQQQQAPPTAQYGYAPQQPPQQPQYRQYAPQPGQPEVGYAAAAPQNYMPAPPQQPQPYQTYPGAQQPPQQQYQNYGQYYQGGPRPPPAQLGPPR